MFASQTSSYGFCVFCYQNIYSSAKAVNGSENVNKFTKCVGKLTGDRELNKLVVSEDESETKLSLNLQCCNKCSTIIDGFCNYYHQFKVLELQMNYKLKQLAGIINHCDRVPSRWKNVYTSLEEKFSFDMELNLKSQAFIRKYRQAVKETCCPRSAQQQPRVLLEAITDFTTTSSLNELSSQTNDEDDDLKNVVTEGNTSSLMSTHMEIEADMSDNDNEVSMEYTDKEEFEPLLDPLIEVKVEATFVQSVSDDVNIEIQSDQQSSSDTTNCTYDKDQIGTNTLVPTLTTPKQQRYSLRDKPDKRKCETVKLETTNSSDNNSDNDLLPDTNAERLSSDISDNNEYSKDHPIQKPTSTKRQKLKSNLVNNSEVESFQCPKCEKSFQGFAIFRRHVKSSKFCTKTNTMGDDDDGTGVLKCDQCDLFCKTKKDLWLHQNKDHEQIICAECGKEFKKNSILKSHLLYHANPSDWQWKCSRCGRSCITKAHLNKHVKKVHKMKNSTEGDHTQQQISFKTDTSTKHQERFYRCNNCKRMFRNEHVYYTHIYSQKEDEFQCDFCPTKETNVLKLSSHEYQNHCQNKIRREEDRILDGNKETFSCARCQYKSNDCADYQYHFAQVHFKFGDPNSTKFGNLKCVKLRDEKCLKPLDKKCEKCGKIFSTNQGLIIHTKSVHSEGRLTCEKCGKDFSCLKYLSQHLETHKDNKDRKWECGKCGRKSLTKQHLEIHMKSHSKEKPFGCEICGEKFKYQKSLSDHIKKQHENEEST